MRTHVPVAITQISRELKHCGRKRDKPIHGSGPGGIAQGEMPREEIHHRVDEGWMQQLASARPAQRRNDLDLSHPRKVERWARARVADGADPWPSCLEVVPLDKGARIEEVARHPKPDPRLASPTRRGLRQPHPPRSNPTAWRVALPASPTMRPIPRHHAGWRRIPRR